MLIQLVEKRIKGIAAKSKGCSFPAQVVGQLGFSRICPETGPGCAVLGAALLTRKEHGRHKGRLNTASRLVLLQSGQQPIVLDLQGLQGRGCGHQINLLAQIAPDAGKQGVIGLGFFADRIHFVQADPKFGAGKKQQDQHQGQGGKGPGLAGAEKPCSEAVQGNVPFGPRRHFREDFRIQGVNKQIGEEEAQGGKLSQFPEHREITQAEHQKGADSGGKSHGAANGFHLPGRIDAFGGVGPVKKEQVSDAVVIHQRDERPGKSQDHNGNGGVQQGIDKQGHGDAGYCRDLGQQTQ